MNCEDTVFSREETIQFAKNEIKRSQIEILEWAMRLCLTGSTPAMIRKAMHNKLVEITGEGEKA